MQFRRDWAGHYHCDIASMRIIIEDRPDGFWIWRIEHDGYLDDGPHDLHATKADAIESVEHYLADNMRAAR